MKLKLFILILLSCVVRLEATHIVGGVITYRYLNGTTYEVTFKVYRDCDASVKTPFDGDPSNTGPNARPFYYTVFDNNTGASILNESLWFISKAKVPSAVVNPCLDTTLSCVEEAVYRDTITLPTNNKWYSIYHQRCCRNSGINNLMPVPGGGGSSSYPGMTIYTVIPPANTYINSSAVFKKYPPLFLCRGQQFNFDHSATDADGDVLKYYLVTPLEGADQNNPQPQIASFTKTDATWQPPYNLSNIMGGTVNANIDENTGLFSCKPDVSGRYVVSIMVKEFRGGICVDSSIRDFQFNVNECDIPKSDLIMIPGSYDAATGLFDYKINCKNKIVDFVNSSTNSGTYLWKFGDPASGTKDTSTLSNPTHEYTDTGVFIVTLISFKVRTDNTICSDTLRVRVRVFPTFNANFSFPVSPPICSGNAVNFTDLSAATFGTTVKWNWSFGDGGTSTLKNPAHSFSTSGTYNVKLTAESSKKCTADTTIPLTVNYSPTINAILPNACIGQPFNAVCNASVPSPDAISSIRWTLPNKVDNNCNTSYTPPNMNSFSINLWAITNKGCKDSQSYTINVNPLPRITAIGDTFICYDSKIQLNASGGVSYSWSPASELNNANIQNPIASPIYPNPSTYTVKGTDALGCYNFDSVTVRFHAKPFIDAGKDTSICLPPSINARDSVRLNGQGNFTTVYWTPSAGLSNANVKNPIAKPSQNTDYVFNGIDANGCIVKDTISIIVLNPRISLFRKNDTFKCSYDTIQIVPLDLGPITSYSWSPTTWVHPADTNKRIPRIYNRDTMTYTLTVRNYCYDTSESIRIDVIPSPKTNLPKQDSTCYGNIYQFNLNPSNTYVWATADPSLSNKSIPDPTCNPAQTVWYYITATNSYGCTVSEAMEMIVNYPPNVSVVGIRKFICLGDSIELSVITNPKTWIRWFPSTYVSNSQAKDIFYYPPKSEMLSVRVYSAGNCYTTNTYNMPVQTPIIPNVERNVHVCKGKYVQLYASGGFYYVWTPFYNLNDSLSDKPQVWPDSTFRYRVKISNDCFQDYDSVLVNVDSLPKVTATPDTSIYRGAEIELVATSAAKKMQWYPQDMILSNPYSTSIRISPQDSQLYKVKVTDGNGCEGFDSVWVAVYSKNILLIPTGFSPNGDGINDVFKIVKHLNVKRLEYFEVYNRWGNKVFYTTNIEQGWDGTYNGEICPVGTYTWQIKITNYDGEAISQSGNIDVIR